MKRIFGLAMLAVVAACGGGGGGASSDGGGSPPPATGIAKSYFPVGAGYRWIYAVVDTEPGTPSLVQTTITGRQLVSGVNAWVFSDTDPFTGEALGESWYAKDTRAYTYLGASGIDAGLNSALAPFDLMRFDGTFSASPLLLRNGVALGLDADGDGIGDMADVRVDGVVEGTETLSTDLGTFANTARVRYDIAGTIKLSSGPTVPFTETVCTWHAPQIGSLRQTLEMKVMTSVTTQSLEATGFVVNGLLGGVVPLGDVLPSLAAPSSDDTRPGHPAVASDGQRYLVVSNRETATGRQWIGRVVGNDASLQQTVEISPPADICGSPALAWNGTNYLLVTGDASAFGMRAQRITRAGVVLDAYPGTQLAADAYAAQLAGGNDSWLAVYRRTGMADTLYGRIVYASGAPGAEFLIATGVLLDAEAAVAFDGTNYLVAWEAGVSSNPAGVDLHARRIGPDGALLDAAPFVVSAAPEAQGSPRIACDAANCLVTWIDRRACPGASYNFSPGPGDMYGAFVTRSGSVLGGTGAAGGLLFAKSSANAGSPGLAFDGTNYVLGWSSGAFFNNPGGPTGIYAVRITTGGVASPGAPGLSLSGTPAYAVRYIAPALASAGGRTLAVWLANSEMSGTAKSVQGTMVAPKIAN